MRPHTQNLRGPVPRRVKNGDVKVSVENNILRVEGERKQEKERGAHAQHATRARDFVDVLLQKPLRIRLLRVIAPKLFNCPGDWQRLMEPIQ